MRYSRSAHVVNVIFIGVVFLAPIGYCLSDPAIPVEVGRGIIMLSFLLGAIAIADWYGAGVSNSMYGILLALVFGGIAALVAATAVSLKSGIAMTDVMLFKTYSGWEGNRLLLKMYVVSIGAVALGLVALPRLLLLRLVSTTSMRLDDT